MSLKMEESTVQVVETRQVTYCDNPPCASKVVHEPAVRHPSMLTSYDTLEYPSGWRMIYDATDRFKSARHSCSDACLVEMAQSGVLA